MNNYTKFNCLQVRARRAAPHPALDAVPRVFVALAGVEAEGILRSVDIEQVRIAFFRVTIDRYHARQ